MSKKGIVKTTHKFVDGFLCASAGALWAVVIEILPVPTWTKRAMQGAVTLIVGGHIATDTFDEDVISLD